MKDDIPEIIRDLLYANKFRLCDDDLGRAARFAFECGADDDFTRSVIQERVRKHKIAQCFVGPFPIPHLKEGEIILGTDLEKNPIKVPLQTLNPHTLTVAGTGAGKTTRILFMALQIIPKIPGSWMIDLRKTEFSALIPYMEKVGTKIEIVRRFACNPLEVPRHVQPRDYAPRIADMMALVFSLPDRATKLLHTTILALYHEHRIFQGSKEYPTLFDVKASVIRNSEANAQARQAVVDSLEPVLLSLGRECLGHRRGRNIEELSKRAIIFEFPGLAEVDKDLLVSTLLLAVFTARIAQGVSNRPMDLWITCDEAARMISNNKPAGGLLDLIGLVRGTGIGLDLSVQSSNVAPIVLSNTANKVAGQCNSASDFDVIGAAMGLSSEERRYLSVNLRTGLFLGQVACSEWRYPFLFEVPKLNLNKMKDNANMETEERDDELPSIPQLVYVPSAPASIDPIATRSTPETTGILSQDERAFLEAVLANPNLPSSFYVKFLKKSPSKVQKLREQLLARGMIKEHRLIQGKGRPTIIIEVLPKGREAVK